MTDCIHVLVMEDLVAQPLKTLHCAERHASHTFQLVEAYRDFFQDKPFGVNLTILPALIPAVARPKRYSVQPLLVSVPTTWHRTQDYDAYARVLAEEKVGITCSHSD